MLPAKLALFSSARSRHADRKLSRLAEMMGVQVQVVDVGPEDRPNDALAWAVAQGHCAAAASAETLTLGGGSRAKSREPGCRPFAGFDFALVYGFAPDQNGERLATALTGGAFRGLMRLNRSPTIAYSLSAEERAVCQQLAGLTLSVDNRRPCFAFAPSSGPASPAPLATAQGLPWFARARTKGCQVFLLSSDDVVDVDMPAPREGLAAQLYPSLMPWLLFLRRAFAESCWWNPNPRAALIIDDPLLRPRYGFLSCDALAREMHAHRFATTIAFIPWNYRRTSLETATLFSGNRDKLSICIHGCDHTGGEFATNDEGILRSKAKLALERVLKHEENTGIGCDPVMVFPQGRFSRASLRALKAEGYLAAVNSTVFPVDYCEGEVTIADLCSPAMTAYGGFPVFQRRYPGDPLPFAFDLFLGKPALIVEHHGYFRDGYAKVCGFVDRINALDPRLSWAPLGEIVRGSALYRMTAPHEVEAKFYSDRFSLANVGGARTLYKLRGRTGAPGSLKSVLLNGVPVEHHFDGDSVVFERDLMSGAMAYIELVRRGTEESQRRNGSFAYRARVAVRRLLCEFRDNYAARGDPLPCLPGRFRQFRGS